MDKMVKLRINGQEVEVPEGTTILEAARTLGIDIPTLCHLEELKPSGSCRICCVEVKGMRGLVPSCAYPVAEGMEVSTHAPRCNRPGGILLNCCWPITPDVVCIVPRTVLVSCRSWQACMDYGAKVHRPKRHYPMDSTSPVSNGSGQVYPLRALCAGL